MYSLISNEFNNLRLSTKEEDLNVNMGNINKNEEYFKTNSFILENNKSQEINHTHVMENESDCSCKNYNELIAKLSECEICMNPLQGPSVGACVRCGGLWCGPCGRRLTRCPYCRAPAPREPCAALTRLLKPLRLPCRNQRWGCTEKVTAELRLAHESSCEFGQMICPLDETCTCCLPRDALPSHFVTSHKIATVKHQRVNIVVEDFAEKLTRTAMTRNKFKICILTKENVFVIKISIFNYNVQVAIMKNKLKYEIDSGKHSRDSKKTYYALIEFQSNVVSNKNIIALKDKGYSRKNILTRKDYVDRSWPGNVHILVEITTDLTDEYVMLL